jgi:hypothetical protein
MWINILRLVVAGVPPKTVAKMCELALILRNESNVM